MNRWYATTKPQHMLPAVAACASGTTRQIVEDRNSKPAPGEAPTSA